MNSQIVTNETNSSRANDAAARSAPARGQVVAWLFGALASFAAAAQPIAIPNGDFSDPGNDGSIGGLLGPNINNELIAAGPWRGSVYGVLGLLAQPTLTVDSESQTATISGLLGINVGGLLNNGGSFRQELATSYQFGRFYVVSADVSADVALGLDLLADGNVGIGLMSGNVAIASSTISDPTMLDLQLIEGNLYRLRFGYLADIAASGFIGVTMFNEPQDLATASLLGSVTFSNMALESRDIGPATGVAVVPGTVPAQAPIGEPFPGAFIAIVEDGNGNGVPGFVVRISAPLDGASADLTSPSSDDPPGRVITAVSDLDGVVTFDAMANDIAGCYRVTVEALDPELQISHGIFHLRNFSDDTGQDSIYCNGYQ